MSDALPESTPSEPVEETSTIWIQEVSPGHVEGARVGRPKLAYERRPGWRVLSMWFDPILQLVTPCEVEESPHYGANGILVFTPDAPAVAKRYAEMMLEHASLLAGAPLTAEFAFGLVKDYPYLEGGPRKEIGMLFSSMMFTNNP